VTESLKVAIQHLELLENNRVTLDKKIRKGSLLGIIDCTQTKIGHRLLRSEIVAPLCEYKKIIERQELVEELLTSPALHNHISHNLANFHDTDQITIHYTVEPKEFTCTLLKREAINAIRLREVLQKLPGLLKLVRNFDSTLGQRLCKQLEEATSKVSGVVKLLNEKLNKESKTQATTEERRLEAVFCVKPNVDGLLDVARLAYAQTIQEMKRYVQALNEKTADLDARLTYSVKRGYHIRLAQNHLGGVPGIFIELVVQKRCVLCTTEELASMNFKHDQTMHAALKRTEIQLHSIRTTIGEVLPHVYSISDTIALLDLIVCFAWVSKGSPESGPFSRPAILNEPPFDLVIVKGRHLIVESAMEDPEMYTPKDLELNSHQYSLANVVGGNCTGKTTFVKQIAIICIMAHLGCFVPAASCKMPLVNRILTRLGNEDNMEANASTFSLEMSEMAYILNTKALETSHQLVLVDEVGRGTSTEEGFAIAWAMANFLQHRKNTFTIFANHFFRTCQQLGRQVTMKPLHCFVANDTDDTHEEGMEYLSKLAIACGFPQHIANRAAQVKENLEDHQAASLARKQQLKALVRDCKIMSTEEIRQGLAEFAKRQ